MTYFAERTFGIATILFVIVLFAGLLIVDSTTGWTLTRAFVYLFATLIKALWHLLFTSFGG